MQWEGERPSAVSALHRDKLQGPAEVDVQAVAHCTSVQGFLDQPALRMGVTGLKEYLTKCKFFLSETMIPAVALPFLWEWTAWPSRRNMLAVKDMHGKRLQVSEGHWVKD